MTSPDHEWVRIAHGNGVTTLTLDSPGTRNALSRSLLAQLLAGLAAAAADPRVRVVVLSHTGRVFCSGVDLTETVPTRPDDRPPVDALGDLLVAIVECPKPVVARVGGPARAGGLGLIAASDIAVSAEEATFAFTEVRLGVIPALISATVLPRLQPRAAAELFLTGEVFDGRRAARIGLVSTAVPAAELDAAVDRYCAALIQGAPQALGGVKDLLRRRGPAALREDIAALSALSAGYFASDEGREGVAAFREKRPPRWAGGDDA